MRGLGCVSEDAFDGEGDGAVVRRCVAAEGCFERRAPCFPCFVHRDDIGGRCALRDEERLAWQRLVRVLGHEINNSLAPIQSIAVNLATQLQRTARPADLDDDLVRGLAVIDRRAAALGLVSVSMIAEWEAQDAHDPLFLR